jgi:hypothetical protein
MTVTLLFVIVVVALVTQLVPMNDMLRKMLYAIVIVVFILWLIAILGLSLPSLRSLP